MFPPTLVVDQNGFPHPIGIHWPTIRPNEWNTLFALAKLSSDEVTYASFHPEIGYSLDMEALGAGPNGELGPEHPGMLEPTMVCTRSICKKDGYAFTYKRIGKDSFNVVARPIRYAETGRFSFLMDQSGVIHATPDYRPATPNDLTVSTRDYPQPAAQKPATANPGAGATEPAALVRGNNKKARIAPRL
jgi:hypothetical protein